MEHTSELVQHSQALLLPNTGVIEPGQPGLHTNREPGQARSGQVRLYHHGHSLAEDAHITANKEGEFSLLG